MKVRTIVVGYDGSPDACTALDAATDHISDDGVVHVVTAFDDRARAAAERLMREVPDEFRYRADVDAAPSRYLREAERTLASRGVAHEGHLVYAEPAAAILEVADRVGADLVVVGSRGEGRVQRFLHGSVSTRLADHATTSLMIVRHDVAVAA